MAKVTTDTILDFLKEAVEAKRPISFETWGDAAFKLNLLLADEHLDLENYRAIVSNNRLEIYKEQTTEKKNKSAADLEIEASEAYRQLKLQEHRVARIEEFIKLAKKNMSQY